MKRYKIYNSETTFYYSTCTIIAWLPIFQEEKYFTVIIDSLKYCQENKGLYLLGYVIMPTHLHLITSNSEDTTLSDIMRDFRQYTSKKVRKLLEEYKQIQFLRIFEKAASKLEKQTYRIWKDDYHPVALKSDKWFHEKINYLHAHPVRKGFVELPEYWKYSSARNWILNDNSIINIDKEQVFPEG